MTMIGYPFRNRAEHVIIPSIDLNLKNKLILFKARTNILMKEVIITLLVCVVIYEIF